ncbi:hypothetical protein ACET3Z_010998 [Daucus carota]
MGRLCLDRVYPSLVKQAWKTEGMAVVLIHGVRQAIQDMNINKVLHMCLHRPSSEVQLTFTKDTSTYAAF